MPRARSQSRNRRWVYIGLSIAGVVLAFFALRKGANPGKEMNSEIQPRVRWEYLTVARPTEKDMNDLGQTGWELVSATPFIFKRPSPYRPWTDEVMREIRARERRYEKEREQKQ